MIILLLSPNGVPQEKRGPIRKKMTNGIVGLTRPRFGKRWGGRGWGPHNNIYPEDIWSPSTLAIFDYYLRKNPNHFDNYLRRYKGNKDMYNLLLNLIKSRKGKRFKQSEEGEEDKV